MADYDNSRYTYTQVHAIYNGDGATNGPKLKANAADYAKA